MHDTMEDPTDLQVPQIDRGNGSRKSAGRVMVGDHYGRVSKGHSLGQQMDFEKIPTDRDEILEG